jgi:hypothetical protein
MSATANSALRARTGRRVRGPLPRTGNVWPHPLLCFATSTATWSAPMVRRWHVSADRHAADARRRAAQLPQMAWSVYRKTIADVLSPPDGLILFCGMSIGYEERDSPLYPYGPGAARRGRHVRRGLTAIACARVLDITRTEGGHHHQHGGQLTSPGGAHSALNLLVGLQSGAKGTKSSTREGKP